MNVNVAFGSTSNYAKVRGERWSGEQAVIATPSTVIFKARVNGAVTGGPALQFEWDTATIGAYSDVQIDQRILISHTDNMYAAFFDGYVLRAPSATTFHMSETGYDLADNDYIFIIDDYPLTMRQAKPIDVSTQWKNGDQTFELMAPVSAGVPGVIVGEVNPLSGKLSITLDASDCYAIEDSAGFTLTYLWAFPSGVATVTAGSLSGVTVSVDVIEGHNWASLLLTDSLGTEFLFHIEIHATGTTYHAVPISAAGAEIESTIEDGYSCRIEAWDGISTLLNGTRFVVYRPKEWYSGVLGPLEGYGNIDFVGYIHHEDNPTELNPQYGSVNSTRFEFLGIAGKLESIRAQQILMRQAAPATQWDELQSLCTRRALIHYYQRHSTYLNLYGMDFDLATDLTLRIPQPADNLLDAGRAIVGKKGSLVFRPDGSLHVVTIIAGYLNQTDRDALLLVANLTETDDFCDKKSVSVEHGDQTGYVDAAGATYNAGVNQVIAYAAIAPSTAATTSPANDKLDGVIIPAGMDAAAAQAYINQDAGNLLAINQETVTFTANMPDGYYPLIPTPNELYAIVYADNERGIAFTTDDRFYLQKNSYTHDQASGSRLPEMVFKKLSAVGSPGDRPPDVTIDDVPILVPDLPNFDDFGFGYPETLVPDTGLLITEIALDKLAPPKHYVVKIDGNTAIIGDDTHVILVQQLINLTNPIERDITPPEMGAFKVKHVMFDMGNQGLSGGNNYAYCLASDGTNSRVYVCPNCFSANPFWQIGADVAGVFTQIKNNGTPGAVEIYGTGSVPFGSASIDPKLDIVAPTSNGTDSGIDLISGQPLDIVGTGLVDGIAFGPYGPNGSGLGSYLGCGATLCQFVGRVGTSGAWFIIGSHFSGSAPATGRLYLGTVDNAGDYYNNTGTFTAVVNMVLGGAIAAVSSDYGLSFGTPVSVGATPGIAGGLDTERVGTVTIAAADNQVKVATAIGGSFSNASGGTLSAEPVSLLIPWYKWGSTTSRNTTGSAPDYAALTNAAGSSLKRITGAGSVTDITPVAGFQGEVTEGLVSLYGTYIAARGLVSGAQKVYVSKNEGGAWALVHSPTDCKVIKIHRSDNRPIKTGGGQIYIADTKSIYYSSKWIGPVYPRNLSITPHTMDIL